MQPIQHGHKATRPQGTAPHHTALRLVKATKTRDRSPRQREQREELESEEDETEHLLVAFQARRQENRRKYRRVQAQCPLNQAEGPKPTGTDKQGPSTRIMFPWDPSTFFRKNKGGDRT